jgi:hypothetical protein
MQHMYYSPQFLVSEDMNQMANKKTSRSGNQVIRDLSSMVEVDGDLIPVQRLIDAIHKAGDLHDEVKNLREFRDSATQFLRREGEQHQIATAASKTLKGIGCSDEEIYQYLEMWVASPKPTEANPSPSLSVAPGVQSLAQIHPLPNQRNYESKKPMTIHTTRDALRAVLATEGFAPKITDTGDFCFKFEGTTCYLVLDESDLQFAAVHRYLHFDLQEPSSFLRGLLAAHAAGSEFKVAKVVIDDAKEIVTVSAELFFHDYETVRQQLPRLLNAVRAAANKFEEVYEESSEEQASGEVDDGDETATD